MVMIDVWRRWRWMVMMQVMVVMMLLDSKTGRTTGKVSMQLLLLLLLIPWMESTHTTSPANTWTTTPVCRTTGTATIDTVRWSVPATRRSWW
uniref:Putative secreted protein n=1 Tax=Anopheles triannulatus TaxID=58253 RepID=A0A2M4B3M5_9DIPT